MITSEQVQAGQAIYTKTFLKSYDFIVLTISNHLIWQCPTLAITKNYNKYISSNHLDVGVGSGYFLANCKFPTSSPRIAIMDANDNALQFTQKRIARYFPKIELYKHNILEPIKFDLQPFDSISINYLLHCLPGTMITKEIVFQNLKSILNPKGKIFGSTLLQSNENHNFFAKKLMSFYNSKGVFSNTQDDFESLKKNLESNFSEFSITIHGCVAIFSAQK